MKKLSIMLAGSLILTSTLFGCGMKEEDMVYLKDFDVTKYVELGDYKGIEVTAPKAEVTDDELNQYVEYMLNYYTENREVTDHDTIVSGDVANIDYVGKKDGVAFDGGTAEAYDLEIGSHSFIDGFEDGVIGMKVGETKDLNLTFPENYGNADLAGQDVVFTVTLNSIKEKYVPELNDEFVASLGQEGINTVDDLKEQTKAILLEDAEAERAQQIASQLQETVQNNCNFPKEAPSGFTDRLSTTLIEGIEEAATAYGMDAATVAAYYYGIEGDDYKQGILDYVKNELAPQYLMVGAIAAKEGITVSDEDVDADIQANLETSGSTMSVDEYKESLGDMESYREYIVVDKVLDFLTENAVVNEE